MSNNRHSQILENTLAALETSLAEYMPDCAYRDFYQWALSASNPLGTTWLEALGVYQTTHLTFELLDGIISDEAWDVLVPYISPMNTYLAYEVVSDNLAIGLARQ